jgi:hypothetical protein
MLRPAKHRDDTAPVEHQPRATAENDRRRVEVSGDRDGALVGADLVTGLFLGEAGGRRVR